MSAPARNEAVHQPARPRASRTAAPAVQIAAHRNALLSALSPNELRLFREIARPVPLVRGADLFRFGGAPDWIWFVEEGLVSIRTSLDDEREIETHTVGAEGVLGLVEAQGGGVATANAHVTVAGVAWRVSVPDFLALELANAAFAAAAAHHFEAVVDELQVGLACHAFHGIDQRLSRWLLERRDRLGQVAEVAATQACLASGLGVQRTSISEAMRRLRARGLVVSGRGVITVRDPAGLEQRSCSCRAALSRRHKARRDRARPFRAD